MFKEGFKEKVTLELAFRVGWEGPGQGVQRMERQRNGRLGQTLRRVQIPDKSYRAPSETRVHTCTCTHAHVTHTPLRSGSPRTNTGLLSICRLETSLGGGLLWQERLSILTL